MNTEEIRKKFEFWHWMKFHQIFTKEEVFKRETQFTKIRDYEREDIDGEWKGYDAGYQQAVKDMEAETQWIDIANELPGHNREVWVMNKEGVVQDDLWRLTGTADCLKWEYYLEGIHEPFSEFIKWAPVEPPMEVEHE